MSQVLKIPKVGPSIGKHSILSGKKLAFLQAYCAGPTMLDPTRSAEVAGYQGKLWSVGRRLEQELGDQINAELSRKQNRSIMNLQEILQELTSVARGEDRDKLGALRTLLEHHTGPTRDKRKELQSQLSDLVSELAKASPEVAVSLGLRIEPGQAPQAQVQLGTQSALPTPRKRGRPKKLN